MQPVSGYQWSRVSGTAAGTTTIKANETRLHAVVIGDSKTGTITVYDNATGTASGYFQAFNNNIGTIPQSVLVDAQFRKGLTVVLGGTVDMTFVYA